MYELFEEIEKEKFRREVQRNISRYMHPEAPPQLSTEQLEAAIEITEKPKPYMMVEGVKCRFMHLIHPSFYQRLPTDEDIESWLISVEEGAGETEPSTSTQASDTIMKKVPTCEKQENSVPASELMCKLQKDSCKEGETVSRKIKELSLKADTTPSVKVKQEPSSVKLKVEPSAAEVKRMPSNDYSSAEEGTSKMQKSGTPIKRKKKHGGPKIKKERLSDLSDDERDYSPHRARRDEKDRYGRSRIKENYSDEEWGDDWSRGTNPFDTNAPGTYYCKYCNSTMNSLGTFENHLRGKRHLKNVKMQTPSEVAMNSLPPSEYNSRYPPVTPNCNRVPIKDLSYIQRVVDSVEESCIIGANNVIEIRLSDTVCTYYCRVCDSPCSVHSILPHLKGSRHLINSLKLYDPTKFGTYRSSDKMDRYLRQAVKEYERKCGRGIISVEKDEISTSGCPVELGPGPSWRHPVTGERYLSEAMESRLSFPGNEPDTSKSDFYCHTCDAHMNNRNMWEAHVRGKRHQKNIRKAPGELPTKTKFVKCDNTPAELEKELRETDEIIVGLDYIRETHADGGVIYNCFLCGACCTPLDIIEHLSLPKHKFKYLEAIKVPEVGTLQNLTIHQSYRNDVIEDVAQKYALLNGSGKVEVYVKALPMF